MRLALLPLLAACRLVPLQPDDCLPTLGDHCSCTPQCMTRAQIDRIDQWCDLGCDTAAEALDWDCTVIEGECAVAVTR
jgi:hypothetical protein